MFPQPQERDRVIDVMIYTRHNGEDPALKSEIDALGEVFREELARVVGNWVL